MKNIATTRPEGVDLVCVNYIKVDGGRGSVTIERLFYETLKGACMKTGERWTEALGQLIDSTPPDAVNVSSYVRTAILQHALDRVA